MLIYMALFLKKTKNTVKLLFYTVVYRKSNQKPILFDNLIPFYKESTLCPCKITGNNLFTNKTQTLYNTAFDYKEV